MIDPALLRDQPEVVLASLATRGASPRLLEEARDADKARREAISAFEQLRAEQNQIGKDVAKAQGAEKDTLLATVKELSERVKEASQQASKPAS